MNRKTLSEMEKGTLLTEAMFYYPNEVLSMIESPVLVGCKADDIAEFANGIIRAGNFIDIYIFDNEMEMVSLLWKNIFVYEAFDISGVKIETHDLETPAFRLNLLFEQEEVVKFFHHIQLDKIKIVKVGLHD